MKLRLAIGFFLVFLGVHLTSPSISDARRRGAHSHSGSRGGGVLFVPVPQAPMFYPPGGYYPAPLRCYNPPSFRGFHSHPVCSTDFSPYYYPQTYPVVPGTPGNVIIQP